MLKLRLCLIGPHWIHRKTWCHTSSHYQHFFSVSVAASKETQNTITYRNGNGFLCAQPLFSHAEARGQLLFILPTSLPLMLSESSACPCLAWSCSWRAWSCRSWSWTSFSSTARSALASVSSERKSTSWAWGRGVRSDWGMPKEGDMSGWSQHSTAGSLPVTSYPVGLTQNPRLGQIIDSVLLTQPLKRTLNRMRINNEKET